MSEGGEEQEGEEMVTVGRRSGNGSMSSSSGRKSGRR
jgi:hypothetical protein